MTDQAPRFAPPAADDLLDRAHQADLEPWALLRAVRDSAGRVVDFVYHDINLVGARRQQRRREDLIGRSVAETLDHGLLQTFAHCVDTGEPLVLDAFALHGGDRRYDVRVARVPPDFLSLSWREVTGRIEALAALRASTDAILDPQVLIEPVRDPGGRVTDFVYREVNPAMCDYLGMRREQLIGHPLLETLPSLDASGLLGHLARCADTGEPVVLDEFPYYNEFLDSVRRYDIRAARTTVGKLSLTLRDVTERFDGLYRRSMESAAVAMCLASPEGPLLRVNQAMCEFFGYDARTLLTKTWIELTAPEYRDADLAHVADMVAGRIESYQMEKEFLHADGHRIWGHLAVGCMRAGDGSVAMSIGQIVDITAEVEARQAVERYRKLMENSNVGMCLTNAEGGFTDVNQAMCDLFGFDRQSMLDKTWQDLTPATYLQADLRNAEDMLAGRTDTYRVTKEFIRADGRQFWADLSASTIRGPTGEVEFFAAQILDISERVQNLKRLQSDLASAADYVRSILPEDVSGPVRVSSRYLPTRELGGDCYNYAWIDDDHLAVYLLDVSGHGVDAAMVSVSVLDTLRSGTLPVETLLSPESVLAELNRRFGMEAHHDHYLTIFYAVYQKPTRTLTYAGAGHPPALVLAGPDSHRLSSQAPPVGMFGDTEFTSQHYRMPAGAQLLLYSDGAFEFPLAGGGELSAAGFAELCRKTGARPGLTLDSIVETLRGLSATGEFEDDCSLVLLSAD